VRGRGAGKKGGRKKFCENSRKGKRERWNVRRRGEGNDPWTSRWNEFPSSVVTKAGSREKGFRERVDQGRDSSQREGGGERSGATELETKRGGKGFAPCR